MKNQTKLIHSDSVGRARLETIWCMCIVSTFVQMVFFYKIILAERKKTQCSNKPHVPTNPHLPYTFSLPIWASVTSWSFKMLARIWLLLAPGNLASVYVVPWYNSFSEMRCFIYETKTCNIFGWQSIENPLFSFLWDTIYISSTDTYVVWYVCLYALQQHCVVC